MISNAQGLSQGDIVTQLVSGSGGELDYRYRVEEVLRKNVVMGQMLYISEAYSQSTRDHFFSAPREMTFTGEALLCSVIKAHYSVEDYIT